MMAAEEFPVERLANVEAEAALLGALMIQNKLIDRVADLISPEHFFEPLHSDIFSVIIREHSLNRTVNPVTLKPYFDGNELIGQVGGIGYLAQLTGSGAAVIGAIDFAEQILELAQRRRLLGRLREIAVGDLDRSYAELVADAETALAEASDGARYGLRELSAREAAMAAVRAGEDMHRRGVLSGIVTLDDTLGALRRKQLIILAARPGMGKSALAGSYGLAASKRGHGVLFISLEMSGEELGARIVSDETFDGRGKPIPYGLIERGEAKGDDLRRVIEAADRLEDLPLQLIDIGQATTGRLNGIIRRWKRRMAAKGIELELVVVDYLQKLRPNHRARDRIEAVAEISQDLKTIAKENDVAVMALSQLSREVEKRADHRPVLSDLRESGQIEQDADAVLFLYRQEYYLDQSRPHDEESEDYCKWERAMELARGQMEFICAKRRQGRTGKGFGQFHGAFAAVRG